MTEGPSERPPRRRARGRRRGGGAPRPQQAPAQPQRPAGGRTGRDRNAPRDDRRLAQRGGQVQRGRQRRGGRGRGPRPVDDVRAGTPCVILLDCREGEPDRSGSPATFEGFFDFETGEPRRAGGGIPRLRVADERLWGFECWWRVDSERAGLTDDDRTELETSKRLLRGLLRDARRASLRAR